ncbi:hypothetical protein [Demequina activiva]|uniref:Uncharacterized protein n=1 Tax=Demequina activiva TaxID=1582364 RepID=A0A919Q2T4_9MICO|nr:hypothetical protein [Demequina activiva]GIG54994.1 hypothetical protein Dac01nite_17460 [Demequina activiva]
MNPTTRATITAVAASVIAATGFLGTRYLAAGVLLVMAGLAVGWPILTRTSRHWVSTAIIGAGSIVALIAVILGRDEPYLRYMVVAVAGIVVAALVTEIFLPSAPGRAVTSVAATAAGGAVAASGAAWVASSRTAGAEDLVVAGAAALAMAAVASVVTNHATINTVLALVLGAASGGVTGFLFDSITWYGGILVGIAAGVSVVLLAELYRREPRPHSVWAGIASAVTPVLVAGVLVYLGGRLLIG